MSNVGSTAPSIPAQYITPNLPTWVIPIFGVLIVIWIATTSYYKFAAIGLVGIIFYWLMQK